MKMPIPVKISPFFYLTAAIIGWLNSQSLVGTLIWMGIIFVSILVHEYGHALTARAFGQSPRIELVAFGGVTYPSGPRLSLGKEFLVVLNGPAFGFGLFLLASFLLKAPAIASSAIAPTVQMFRFINLFWTLVNLLPVLPLDGGQLLRIIFESFFGSKGFRFSVLFSIIFSVLAGIACMAILGWYLIGAIFFLFTFQNLQTWKVAKTISSADQNLEFQTKLFQAEEEMLKGNDDQAIAMLEELKNSSHEGLLHTAATQHLIRLKFKKGMIQETYDLLLSIEKDLTPDLLELLHFSAFELKKYDKVKDLAALCYQNDPSLEVALRNAIALSALKDVKSTIGWVEAAIRAGLENPKQVLEESAFDSIRNEPDFTLFMETLNSESSS